jgi:hypothetical protein
MEKRMAYNGAACQLFICCMNAYDSVRREVLFNFYSEFSIPMKEVRLIKMCLKETYDCLCGLVVRVSGYKSRGPRFDSRPYQIF